MMPLIVKDFSWHQTPDIVSLVVNIKGIKADKTDILTSNNYIRIHYHPYIFEAFLSGEVDDVRGSCTIDQGSNVVLIQLPKVNAGQEWASLENKGLSRMEKREIREGAVSTSHKRHEEQAQARAALRQEQKQLTVREQIRLDDEERQRIAAIKRAESNKALEEMKIWASKNEMVEGETVSQTKVAGSSKYTKPDPRFEDRLAKGDNGNVTCLMEDRGMSLEEIIKRGPPSVSILSSDEEEDNKDDDESILGENAIIGESPLGIPISSGNDTPTGACCRPPKSKRVPKPVNKDAAKYLESKVIWPKDELSSSSVSKGEKQGLEEHEDDDHKERQNVPGIRQEAHISVKFTPREFPTPARESSAPEEEEWLKKQAEARRTSGFNDVDLRPEERDPSWLLDKGMSLMKTECHLGAVSAFSLGIKLAPKMPELYVERASAQLALRNFVKTVEDASQGLELLTPKVNANARDRLKCHVTRASGFRELKMNREALMDLKEAILLDPDNLELHKQIDDIQKSFNQKKLRGTEAGGNSSSSDED